MTGTPLAWHFAAAMHRLGPFGPRPHLAIAASGGADSTALALLARDWVRERDGTTLALIIDHGLRPASAEEASLAAARLRANGIAAQILTLAIRPGAGLQNRARIARHRALAAAAAAAGAVHLLFGHHAADQAESVAMRAVRGPGGAAGIAGFSARHDVVLLRPLLEIDPADLRAYLRQCGVAWIEDPSNADPRFERARVRGLAPSTGGDAAAYDQAACDIDSAQFLARHARIDPAGFALVRADRLPVAALSGLIRVIGGAPYPPSRGAVERLARDLRSATLGGVQIMRAGRLGPGWLLCRECAGCAPPVPARVGAVWDGRFAVVQVPEGAATIGPLGAQAARFRARPGLPSVILRSSPAFFESHARLGTTLDGVGLPGAIRFAPPAPVAPAPFGPLPRQPRPGDPADGTVHHCVPCRSVG
jgi:tRNA(Ile)-lysidine synthase